MTEYSRNRAEAMAIRDTRAQMGGVAEEDWGQIQDVLHVSWKSLWQAIHQ